MAAMEKLLLVGMMGSGKTTVGRLAAELAGCPFADGDDRVEAIARMSVPDCFRQEGEARFREWERRAAEELLAEPGTRVVALGGGAFPRPEIRELARGRAVAVFLDVAEGVLERRLAGVGMEVRPLLARVDWRERLRELTAGRRTAYMAADVRLAVTDGETPAETAERVVAAARAAGWSG